MSSVKSLIRARSTHKSVGEQKALTLLLDGLTFALIMRLRIDSFLLAWSFTCDGTRLFKQLKLMNSKAFRAVALAAALLAQPALAAGAEQGQSTSADGRPAEKGFTRIFNGKDLAGWNGNPKFWSVKDGAITGQTTAENPTKGNTFLIWTNGTPGDFELRCSFKLVPGDAQGFANSGIQYRSKVADPANWVVGGYQADMEAGPTFSGILYEERGRGIMAMRGEKVVWDKENKKQDVGSVGDAAAIGAAIKKGGWNEYVIIAKGNHLQHFVNGRQTVDVTDEQASKAAKSGILALQVHQGLPMKVQFKNIRIKKL